MKNDDLLRKQIYECLKKTQYYKTKKRVVSKQKEK